MKKLLLKINVLIVLFCLSSNYTYSQTITKLKDLVGTGTNARIGSDFFGRAVAIDGDLMVVGARQQDYDSTGGSNLTDAGAAYIFSKDQGGTGNWGLVKKITANARNNGDQFGESVAISGDVIVVGAYRHDYDSSGLNFENNAGAAYIFYKDEGGSDNWGHIKKIFGTGTNGRIGGDLFGRFVAISGDVIVAGAGGQDYDSAGGNSVSSAGAAFVFGKNTGGTDNWGQIKKLTGKGTNGRIASDNFGARVDISGDVIVIGASGQDYDSAGGDFLSGAGAAYVFSKNEGGTDNWGHVKKLTGKGTNGRLASDNFGTSVAISNNVIVAGASQQSYDSAGGNFLSGTGAAYIFSKDEGGTDNWGHIKKITGKGTNGRISIDNFGFPVDISDDVIVVGAYQHDYDDAGTNFISDAGGAFVFSKDEGGTDNWGQLRRISATGTNGRNSSDYFSFSLAISSDNIVVGAHQQDYDAAGANLVTNAGKATVYSLAYILNCTSSAWSITPSSSTGNYDATVVSGTCAINSGSALKTIDVQTGATVTIASGDVTVTESFTNNGTISGAGILYLGGTTAQSILGTGTTNNLSLTNSAGAFITDSLKISGVYRHTTGVLTTNNKLRLVATGATTYGQIANSSSSGSISGQVIAEYFIPSSSSGKWRSICSPLTGVTINDLSDDININYGTPAYLNSNVWALDESQGGSSSRGAWAPISSSTQTMDNDGFSIYLWDDNVSSDITIDVQGTYNDGNYTTPALTRTGSIGDTTGWHLLRNPWPSNYIHSFTMTNLVSNTIYVTEGNTFRDWNGTTGTLSNGLIPPFHAFYAEINSHNNTLTLSDGNRFTGNSANYHDKTGLINYVAVKATNEQDIWDETRVYQNDKAENGFDSFDAKKRVNGVGAPTIYTQVDNQKVSINLIKNVPTKGISFPLLFSAYESGKYTLSFTEDNIASGIEVVLEDLDTKTLHKATDGEYEFNYNPTTAKKQRFVLHYQRKSGTSTSIDEAVSKENIFVSSQNKEVHISFGNEGDYTVSVYDLIGREMYNGKTVTNGGTLENINLDGVAAGYYIVNVSSQNSKQTFKVFLK